MSYSTGAELIKYQSKKRREELVIERFVNKVHIIKHMGTSAYIGVPKALVGKRVKLVIVDEE